MNKEQEQEREPKWEYLVIKYSNRDDFEEADLLLKMRANRVGTADKSFTFYDRESYNEAVRKLKEVRRLQDFETEP